MENIILTFESVSPLLIHNERLANPLDKYSRSLKEVTSKTKKTDADHEQMRRLEWIGGLYYDDDIGPYVPDSWISAVLREGAKRQKLGKTFLSAVFPAANKFKIEYKGPRDIEKMYADERFVDVRAVKVKQNKTMRCRPKFQEWSVIAALGYDEQCINRAQLLQAATDAGQYCGMGDYRPLFGRFTVKVS